MQNVKHILYDLDGTLVDNFHAIHVCYTYVQKKLGLAPASYEKVLRTVGGSVPVTMQRLTGLDDVTEAVELFREHFPKVMYEGLKVMPGVPWVLEQMHQRNYVQAVFTNKHGSAARPICDYCKLCEWLDKIIGTGDTPYRKPQREFSEHVLDVLNASPENTILVGDSPFDLEAGKVVGLKSYLVATGSHSYEDLTACTDPAADGVYHDFYALGEQLFGLEKPQTAPA